jgi:hypothetical protein
LAASVDMFLRRLLATRLVLGEMTIGGQRFHSLPKFVSNSVR